MKFRAFIFVMFTIKVDFMAHFCVTLHCVNLQINLSHQKSCLFPHELGILLCVEDHLAVFSHIPNVTHFPENGKNSCFPVEGCQCLLDSMTKPPIVNTLILFSLRAVVIPHAGKDLRERSPSHTALVKKI